MKRLIRKSRRSQAGVTLLEAMIAGLVFTIGLTGLFSLLGTVSGANRHLAFKEESIALYAQLAAEIRDAQCDYPASTPPAAMGGTTADPTLLAIAAVPNFPGVGTAPYVPVAGSVITTLGDFPDANPPMRVDVIGHDTTAAFGAPGMTLEIRVRQITNDPVKDAPALLEAPWIRVFPVEKLCNARLLPVASFATNAALRGEY